MFLQFLKQIGVGQVLGRPSSRREENLKKWDMEQERKTVRERGRKRHHEHDSHPHQNPHLDQHHHHDDWTY